MPSMGGSSSGRGSKFFTTSKKGIVLLPLFQCVCVHISNCLPFRAGEIYELKAQLNSDRRDKKRDAIKKVIANMTVGKDVRCDSRL